MGDVRDPFPDDPTRWGPDYSLRRGDIVVADYKGGLVKIVASTGEQVQLAWAPDFVPVDVVVTDEGEIFATSLALGGVHWIEPLSGSTPLLFSGGYLRQPIGISSTRDGKLVVADPEAGRVIEIDPKTGAQSSSGPYGAPVDVFETEDGAFATTDQNSTGVLMVEAGATSTGWVTEGGHLHASVFLDRFSPEAFVVTIPLAGADCNFLCGATMGGVVEVDVETGAQRVAYAATEFSPLAVATDLEGRIVVTVPSEAAVVRIDPVAGTREEITSSGYLSQDLVGIAVVPVDIPLPEPGSNLLRLVALLALARLRRRRQGGRP